MSRLEQLPEISDSVLHDLRADDALKYRILQKSLDQPSRAVTRSPRRSIIALVSLSAAMIAAFIFLGSVRSVSTDTALSVSASQTESFSESIHTITAGGRRSDSPIGLDMIIDEALLEESDDSVTPQPTEEIPDTD